MRRNFSVEVEIVIMQRLARVLRGPVARTSVSKRTFSINGEAWGVFPREREGNVYSVNWSLTEDGVTPIGDAFRNARVEVLESKLGAKIEGGKVSVSKPAYTGKCTVTEAGADITHQEFSSLLTGQQDYLSAGVELFVEDGGLGAASDNRIGVRVVSDSPALAMIARNLVIKTPQRGVDHRARFNGWNLDPRWIEMPEGHFDENDQWVDKNGADQESAGQRPIVAFVGGAGSHCAIQFAQRKDGAGIVGANITAGADAPVSAIVEAITEAACGVINAQQAGSLAVPSCSVAKGESVTLIVNADDSVNAAALASGNLYGAYGNILTDSGLTAMWDGVVGPTPASPSNAFGAAPFVVNGNSAAITTQPDNMVASPASVVFYEAGAVKKAISEDEAVARLLESNDDSKEGAIRALLKGAKCSVAGAAKDCF
jgi:hypothetical protein